MTGIWISKQPFAATRKNMSFAGSLDLIDSCRLVAGLSSAFFDSIALYLTRRGEEVGNDPLGIRAPGIHSTISLVARHSGTLVRKEILSECRTINEEPILSSLACDAIVRFVSA